MKSIKSKVFLLALGCFVISASFAQDTTKKPNPDTTKMPKHDSSMVKQDIQPANNGNSVKGTALFMINDENKLAAKKEATNDITI